MLFIITLIQNFKKSRFLSFFVDNEKLNYIIYLFDKK